MKKKKILRPVATQNKNILKILWDFIWPLDLHIYTADKHFQK